MHFSGKKVLDLNHFGNSEEEGLTSQVDNNQWMRSIKSKWFLEAKYKEKTEGRDEQYQRKWEGQEKISLA